MVQDGFKDKTQQHIPWKQTVQNKQTQKQAKSKIMKKVAKFTALKKEKLSIKFSQTRQMLFVT